MYQKGVSCPVLLKVSLQSGGVSSREVKTDLSDSEVNRSVLVFCREHGEFLLLNCCLSKVRRRQKVLTSHGKIWFCSSKFSKKRHSAGPPLPQPDCKSQMSLVFHVYYVLLRFSPRSASHHIFKKMEESKFQWQSKFGVKTMFSQATYCKNCPVSFHQVCKLIQQTSSF